MFSQIMISSTYSFHTHISFIKKRKYNHVYLSYSSSLHRVIHESDF